MTKSLEYGDYVVVETVRTDPFPAIPEHSGCKLLIVWYQTEKVGIGMQVIVLKSPRLLRGVLRRLFGIRSNTQE